MFYLKSLVLASLLIFMASVNAKANGPFYVEPYTGYFIGDREGDGIVDGELNSLYAGLRLGVEMKNGLILGVDYGQTLTGDFDAENNNSEGDYEQKDMGAFIGYRITPYVRIYGSYIFKYESEVDFDNSTSNPEFEGDGFNVGISLKPASNIKIGVEYQIRNIKEFSDGTDVFGDNESKTYMLTLQLPVPLPFAIR